MTILDRNHRGQLASILAVALVVGLLVSLATGVIGRSSNRTVVAQFADAQSITKGNTVHVDGVTAGTVSKIRLKGNSAYLTLSIGKGFWPLHSDASATVRPISLLGENYVDLNPGSPSAPVMGRGAMITSAHTSNAVNLQSVFNAFNDPTATAYGIVLTSLGQGMAGQGGNAADALKALSPAFTDTTKLTNLLDQQDQTLTALLDNLTPVTNALATKQGQTLDHLVGTYNTTLAATSKQSVALGQDLQVLPGFLHSTSTAFTQLGVLSDQATPALQSLSPLSNNLAAVSNELSHFTTAADPAIASLKPVLPQAQAFFQQTGPVISTLQTASASGLSDSQALIPLVQKGLTGACSNTACQGLDNLFGFVRNWSLATQNYDGLSHYFRFFGDLNPGTVLGLPNSSPTVQAPAVGSLATKPPVSPPVTIPALPNPASSVTGAVGGLLGGLLGGAATPGATPPPTTPGQSATGLSSGQEQNLYSYLLGGL